LNAAIADDLDLEAVLLFGDSDAKASVSAEEPARRVIARCPRAICLLELEAAGRIQSLITFSISRPAGNAMSQVARAWVVTTTRVALRDLLTRGP
jgi:hypothetical protein